MTQPPYRRKKKALKRKADNMGSKNRKRAVNLLTTLVVLAALFGFIYIAAGAQAAPPGEEYTDRADSSFLLLDSDPSLSVSTELLRQPPSPTPEPADATPEPSEEPVARRRQVGRAGRERRSHCADGSGVFLYLHRQRLDLGGARVFLYDPAQSRGAAAARAHAHLHRGGGQRLGRAAVFRHGAAR